MNEFSKKVNRNLKLYKLNPMSLKPYEIPAK